MRRKPRNPNESVFFGIRKWLITIPIILAITSLLLFAYVLQVNGWNSSLAIAKGRTMVFGVLVFFELFFALSCRSFTHNIHELRFFGNKMLLYSLIGESVVILFIMNYPPMQELFDFVPLAARRLDSFAPASHNWVCIFRNNKTTDQKEGTSERRYGR